MRLLYVVMRYGGRDSEALETYLNLDSLELALKKGLEIHAKGAPKSPRLTSFETRADARENSRTPRGMRRAHALTHGQIVLYKN